VVFIILYFSSLAAAVWWTVTTISWTVLVFCSLEVKVSSSVADPEFLSRIPDPDFHPSRIPDTKTAKKERVKKNLLSYFF
jgi:hypothetical protein